MSMSIHIEEGAHGLALSVYIIVLESLSFEFEFEWGFYALSASKAIERHSIKSIEKRPNQE